MWPWKKKYVTREEFEEENRKNAESFLCLCASRDLHSKDLSNIFGRLSKLEVPRADPIQTIVTIGGLGGGGSGKDKPTKPRKARKPVKGK